jgi:hypothetical protein
MDIPEIAPQHLVRMSVVTPREDARRRQSRTASGMDFEGNVTKENRHDPSQPPELLFSLSSAGLPICQKTTPSSR